MIIDSTLLFENALAASTLTVATTPSTNVIDLGVSRDIGIDIRPIIWAQVGTALLSATGTLQWELQSSADNSTFFTICSGPAAIPQADLTAGMILMNLRTTIRSPTQRRQNLATRYVRLRWIVATAVFTAGTISAGMVLDEQDWLGYPNNYNV